ncbi:methyltransferase family protein [Streptantibioticus silvisoli]|uniref:Isoprenylcysteine carboxylmethyltransferase family protein n=1 Tax=Streptantibioticus silvisoli TaxID=2705255 RepID=A0ABT6W2H3_9ACTN|nr:isoprenylcysteine carboxylmethyltransferase family protein [Streptantibioticus silvisoli]MDI5964943.1 isoprenylcysteine carboxylmethyltransferase family protein [Streptantibioticus silvisoli]
MKAYFDHHVVSGVLFGATLVVWMASELRQGRKTRTEAQKTDRQSFAVARICVGAAWLVTALTSSALPATTIHGGGITFGVGLAICWMGIALRWWAFRTLGRFFTFKVMTSADQPVIRTGPYRVLRHPSYTGAEVAFLGMAVMYGNWIGVAALAVLPMVGFANRIRVEEAALNATLGDAYRAFATGRKRMIPFVW